MSPLLDGGNITIPMYLQGTHTPAPGGENCTAPVGRKLVKMKINNEQKVNRILPEKSLGEKAAIKQSP